ncbi:MAG: hypothetical protein WAX89_02675 [Alphaproteobacteria bacterium]
MAGFFVGVGFRHGEAHPIWRYLVLAMGYIAKTLGHTWASEHFYRLSDEMYREGEGARQETEAKAEAKEAHLLEQYGPVVLRCYDMQSEDLAIGFDGQRDPVTIYAVRVKAGGVIAVLENGETTDTLGYVGCALTHDLYAEDMAAVNVLWDGLKKKKIYLPRQHIQLLKAAQRGEKVEVDA